MKYLFIATVSLALGMLMLIASPSVAQNCATPTRTIVTSTAHNHHVVVKEKEIATVAVPVLVPATVFQYLPAVTPVVAVPAVPVAPAAPTTQPAQTSAADIDKLIRERLDALLKEKEAQVANKPDDSSPPPLTFDEVPTSGKAAKDVAWLSAMRNACARCHQEGKATKGGVTLFNKNDGYAPNVQESTIAEAIRNGSMPMGTTLSANVKQQLLAPLE